MNTLLMIGIIFLFLLLLIQLRLWVSAEYGAAGLRVWGGWGPIHISVFPPGKGLKKRRGKKVSKAKKPEKSKQDKTEKEKPKLGASLDMIHEFLNLALELGGRFQRKLRVDWLILHVNWGLDDPADAAVSYGLAQGVLRTLIAALEVNFKVKKLDTTIDLNCTLDKPNLYLKAACSLTLGQAISLGFFAGTRALSLLKKQRKQKRTTTIKAV